MRRSFNEIALCRMNACYRKILYINVKMIFPRPEVKMKIKTFKRSRKLNTFENKMK